MMTKGAFAAPFFMFAHACAQIFFHCGRDATSRDATRLAQLSQRCATHVSNMRFGRSAKRNDTRRQAQTCCAQLRAQSRCYESSTKKNK
jgi:hypothetical protein